MLTVPTYIENRSEPKNQRVTEHIDFDNTDRVLSPKDCQLPV